MSQVNNIERRLEDCMNAANNGMSTKSDVIHSKETLYEDGGG